MTRKSVDLSLILVDLQSEPLIQLQGFTSVLRLARAYSWPNIILDDVFPSKF
jgi:hypothetical protein